MLVTTCTQSGGVGKHQNYCNNLLITVIGYTRVYDGITYRWGRIKDKISC